MRKIACYCITRNLYGKVLPSLKSLLMHSDVEKVYLLIEDDKFPVPLPENVKCVNVSKQSWFLPSSPNFNSPWTYMVMMRAALCRVFPEYDMILSLDADTIIDQDISGIWQYCDDDHYFAAVREIHRFSEDQFYVNNGVALYNLRKMRDGKADEVIHALNTRYFQFVEQDALNELCAGRILELPSEYNCCRFTKPCDSPRIYHFAAEPGWFERPLVRAYLDALLDKKPEKGGTKMPKTRTCIAIPCMNMVHTEFMTSLLGLQRIGETRSNVTMSSLIYDARNMMAGSVIDNGFDRVLWLDSDMKFEPDLMKRLSDDMDEYNLDYVSGLYFMRKYPTSPVIYKTLIYDRQPDQIRTKAEAYMDYPQDQLFEIDGSGFGAVLMKASVIKAVWDTFGMPFSPLMGLGEDMSFCWRAKQIGIKMWCDSRVKLGHLGTFEVTEAHFLHRRQHEGVITE